MAKTSNLYFHCDLWFSTAPTTYFCCRYVCVTVIFEWYRINQSHTHSAWIKHWVIQKNKMTTDKNGQKDGEGDERKKLGKVIKCKANIMLGETKYCDAHLLDWVHGCIRPSCCRVMVSLCMQIMSQAGLTTRFIGQLVCFKRQSNMDVYQLKLSNKHLPYAGGYIVEIHDVVFV